MFELAIIADWAAFALRWLHVVTAIAWIGSSFYFIALDLGLDRGVAGRADGEAWQVHGGGFYHIQKYLVAPERLPDRLTWFKWEAYSTWLSGAALLAVVYWFGADLYLIDRGVADLAVWQAIGLSAVAIAGGWLVYDALCRSALGHHPTALMLLLFALITALSWGLSQVFSGRAALLHLGAVTATIMSANVFFVIMPNQRIVVGDLKAGRTPNPEYGRIAKLRSTHNNYLTLPVVFLMLSNHYPLAFATEWNWAIAALVFVMGVLIRHFFNAHHAGQGMPGWTWAAAAIVFVALMWLSTAPMRGGVAARADGLAARYEAAEGFEAAHDIVTGRCAMCHAREPVWAGIRWAPKGVVLETPADVAAEARRVYLQSAVSHAMPPGNLTGMTAAERARLVAWYEGVPRF